MLTSSERYQVLDAAVRAANSVQNDRNRLAHWIWGSAPELPDALLLADPTILRSQEVERTKYHLNPFAYIDLPWEKVAKLYQFDPAEIYVYTKADLRRTHRDLASAGKIFFLLRMYLHPIIRPEVLPDHFRKDSVGTSAFALRELSKIGLFREVLDRLKTKGPTDQGSNPQQQP
jgi:hypothetical protein